MKQETALKLAASSKNADLQKLLTAWVRALLEGEEWLLNDNGKDVDEDDLQVAQIINNEVDGETALDLTIAQVDRDSRYDGETFNDTYVIKNASTGEILNYFRVSGCYSSWDGTEVDDEIVLVMARNVVVTHFYTKDELKAATKNGVVFADV